MDFFRRSATGLVLVIAAASAAPSAMASDRNDAYEVAVTVIERAFGDFTECDPLITVSGSMGSGSILLGERASGREPAVFIVDASRTLSAVYGVDPAPAPLLADEGLREEIREIDAILIGTTGMVEVSGLAIPLGWEPGR